MAAAGSTWRGRSTPHGCRYGMISRLASIVRSQTHSDGGERRSGALSRTLTPLQSRPRAAIACLLRRIAGLAARYGSRAHNSSLAFRDLGLPNRAYGQDNERENAMLTTAARCA